MNHRMVKVLPFVFAVIVSVQLWGNCQPKPKVELKPEETEMLDQELPKSMPAADFTLISQDKKEVKLSDFKGKAVLIDFIYTSCPMPNMCPRMTEKFAGIQQKLKDRLDDKVVLMTITFDPEYDTPAVMKKYGEMFGADFSNWYFLTGDPAKIEEVAHTYKVWYEVDDEGNWNHTMNAALVDQDGMVHKEYSGIRWTTEQVVEDIEALFN